MTAPDNYTVNFVATKWRVIRNFAQTLPRRLPCLTCFSHESMARAAMAGMSLSDYLLAEIRKVAERSTLAELRERLHKREPFGVQLDTAQLVHKEREAR